MSKITVVENTSYQHGERAKKEYEKNIFTAMLFSVVGRSEYGLGC